MFSQTPSSLLEIRDWTVAREIDTAAAAYICEEERKREVAREKRDREFWVMMFGGEQSSDDVTLGDSGSRNSNVTLEDSMGKSALARNW